MHDFAGRVAVVTGAASGIGFGLATRFAEEGMRVALADVEEQALEAAVTQLRRAEHDVIGVVTDVSSRASVDALASKVVHAWGKVHVLCNNAGVGAGGLSWEQPEGDWEWVLGVNLWGVIHGVRAFLPAMLAHGEEGHIVNTASVAGLLAGPYQGPYNVAKFGVVALSETLYSELKISGATIGVSVLCPGFVSTHIIDSARNRPAHFGAATARDPDDPRGRAIRDMIASGMPPETVAGKVLDAVREDRLYILTHDEFTQRIRERMERIVDQRNPSLPSPDWPRSARPTDRS